VADSLSGRVTHKFLLPPSASGGINDSIDAPTLIHALSPQTLLVATDSSALHVYDTREPSFRKASQTHHPHDDYISSITPLPATAESTSGWSKQWVTTGGTTLAVTDLRRGVLVKSEDQEEELLSSVAVQGLPSRPGRSSSERVVVGSSTGVLTLWDRGVWDDQSERIIVDGLGKGGGESLDCLEVMPDGVGDGHKNLVVGVGDGSVRIVRLGPNKVTASLRHDEVEGVVGVGFDCFGRLISGGGETVKVWEERAWQDVDEEEEEDSDEDDSEDEAPVKRAVESESEKESSDDEDRGGKRKKRKKDKKNLGNGILGFKGMD
jgi:WD40 repeat protein